MSTVSDDLLLLLLVLDVLAVLGCVAVLAARRARSSTVEEQDAAPAHGAGPGPDDLLVVSPDGTRSARWDGTSDRHNAVVFAGPLGLGEPLFHATFVAADSPAAAARLAARLDGTADSVSLGAQGSTGSHAHRLYYCALPTSGDAAAPALPAQRRRSGALVQPSSGPAPHGPSGAGCRGRTDDLPLTRRLLYR